MTARVRSLFLLTLLSIAAAACGSLSGSDERFTLTGSEKRYDLTGKVVSVDKPNQVVNVAHDEVKDFMPAMTMPFVLKDAWAFDVLAPGQQIAATLIVDGPRSWLQDVVITQHTGDPSGPGASSGQAQPGMEVPDFELTNQNNKSISLHDYRGKSLLLTFIYTRCPLPEYCTLMSTNFAQLERELAKDPKLFSATHLLSISIDPEHDKPDVLKSYGAAHTGRYSDEKFTHWEFAGGSNEQVRKVADYFGLQYYPEKDQIIHNLTTALIAPDGKIHKIYSGNEWKPEEVMQDVSKLIDSRADAKKLPINPHTAP